MIEDKLIVITPEHCMLNEPDTWIKLLETGVGKIHIRKPKADVTKLSRLIDAVPPAYKSRLVMHYHPQIAIEHGTGFHVPYSNMSGGRVLMPASTTLSASVHNWQEAEMASKMCSYFFISPVFDSISKIEYPANTKLQNVPTHMGSNKIYALGGVRAENIKLAISSGYYGVAVLGALWNSERNAIDTASHMIDILEEQPKVAPCPL